MHIKYLSHINIGDNMTFKILTTIPLVLFLTACGFETTGSSPKDYNTASTQQAQEVIKGTIDSKRQIDIETDAQTGEIIGGIVGFVAGGSIDAGDNEQAVASVVGALAGSAIGKKIEQSIIKKTATEYIIEKQNGTLTAIISLDNAFTPGQSVLVILSNPPIMRLQ